MKSLFGVLNFLHVVFYWSFPVIALLIVWAALAEQIVILAILTAMICSFLIYLILVNEKEHKLTLYMSLAILLKYRKLMYIHACPLNEEQDSYAAYVPYDFLYKDQSGVTQLLEEAGTAALWESAQVERMFAFENMRSDTAVFEISPT